jgi:hypothetical protein
MEEPGLETLMLGGSGDVERCSDSEVRGQAAISLPGHVFWPWVSH